MLPSQKKSSQKSNHSKFKPHQNNPRWDHTAFDQFQLEYTSPSYKENNKPAKGFTKRIYYATNHNHSSDSTQTSSNDTKTFSQGSHITSNPLAQDEIEEPVVPEAQLWPTRANTQPENQSPMMKEKSDKQAHSWHKQKSHGRKDNNTESSQKEKNIQNPYAPQNKEKDQMEDKTNLKSNENNSILANKALTTPKQPRNRGGEHQRNSHDKRDTKNREHKGVQNNDDIRVSQGVPPAKLLYVFELEAMGHREYINIYEEEDDYEALLERVCLAYGLKARAALYFKINVLRLIKEAHPEPRKLESTLNRLLDINFKLLLVENQLERADESLWPYLHDPVL